MPETGGIQLLPESRRKIDIKKPGENRLLILGLVLLFVVAGGYFVLNDYNNSLISKFNGLSVEFIKLDKDRDEDTEDKILELKDRMKVVNSVLDNHRIVSLLLSTLESKTSPSVKYKAFEFNFSTGNVEINMDVKNYTALARQMASYISSDLITDLEVGSIEVINTGGIQTSMILHIDTDELLFSNIIEDK